MRRVLWTLSAIVLTVSHAVAQNEDAKYETALAYLQTLYAFDFDNLGNQLTMDAVFRDPTAVSFSGEALLVSGRSPIITTFKSSAAATRNAGFEIERHFTTGDHVVLSLTYKTEIDGEQVGVPGEWVPVRVRAVTVITISAGMVREHVDYVDYEELLEQLAEYRKGHR